MSFKVSYVVLIRATGFQEALVRQVRDVAELLGSDYAWVRISPRIALYIHPSMTLLIPQVGVGRTDGASAGEFSPIFYRR